MNNNQALIKEVTHKINFTMSSRKMKAEEVIKDHLPFPENETHEEEIIRDVIFQFLKKTFPGCKLRVNANSISMRLDGAVHRKANKLKEIWDSERQWRTFFQSNHRNIYDTIRQNLYDWRSAQDFQYRLRDQKQFVYVPYKPNRIYAYHNHGLIHLVNELKRANDCANSIANVYDDFIRIMQQKIEEDERRRREEMERQLRDYQNAFRARTIKPVTQLQESDDPIDRALANKILEWARDHGKAPEYAVDATYRHIVPQGTQVRVMSEIGSDERNWYAVPMQDGFEIPEGYEMQEGFGDVTKHDEESERSRNGEAPVVIEEYLYTSFDQKHWEHVIPAYYFELLEVTNQFRAQVEEELAPVLEQQRKEYEEQKAQEEKLAAEQRELEQQRVKEEADRLAAQIKEQQERTQAENHERTQRSERAQDRRRSLTDQLRAQVTQPEVTYQPPQHIPSDEADTATAPGIYRNRRTIPLERYVAINNDGDIARFSSIDLAADWLAYEPDDLTIHDYHEPHDVLEVYEYRSQNQQNDDTDLPF